MQNFINKASILLRPYLGEFYGIIYVMLLDKVFDVAC